MFRGYVTFKGGVYAEYSSACCLLTPGPCRKFPHIKHNFTPPNPISTSKTAQKPSTRMETVRSIKGRGFFHSGGRMDQSMVQKWRGFVKGCYCCWFRNPVNSPVEVGSFVPIIYKVLYIPGGAGFLPSTVCDKLMSFRCHQLSSSWWHPLIQTACAQIRKQSFSEYIIRDQFGFLPPESKHEMETSHFA